MEWDTDQQALMLALDRHRSLIHGPCGGYLPDTTAPEAEDSYRVRDPTRCHLCTARQIKAEEYRDTKQPDALLFSAEKKGR